MQDREDFGCPRSAQWRAVHPDAGHSIGRARAVRGVCKDCAQVRSAQSTQEPREVLPNSSWSRWSSPPLGPGTSCSFFFFTADSRRGRFCNGRVRRYKLYGSICTEAAKRLAEPETRDFFARLIQRVVPKHIAQVGVCSKRHLILLSAPPF